jgi:hypothetical protein
MENLKQQFANLDRQEPTYHAMRNKLMEAMDELAPKPEIEMVDHGQKAEGINVLGKEDGFTGKMNDLKIMLADIDQQISEKTGRESNITDSLFDNIYSMIRKQLSEVV